MLGAYWHKNVYIITLLIEQSVQKCYKYIIQDKVRSIYLKLLLKNLTV